MKVTRKEDIIKEELMLSLHGELDRYGAKQTEAEIQRALDEKWRRVVLNFQKVAAIDRYGLEMLWNMRQKANNLQKALEISMPGNAVARALQLTGFAELFAWKADVFPWDDAIAALGKYGEPVYGECSEVSEICIGNQNITQEAFVSVMEDFQNATGYQVREWAVFLQDDGKKILVFLEGEHYDACDGEHAEEMLESILKKRFDLSVFCRIYLLQKNSFADYCDRQKYNGVPAGMTGVKRFLFNPLDKQFFLDRMDERY